VPRGGSRIVSLIFIALEPDSGYPLPETLPVFLLAAPPTETLLWLFAILILALIAALFAASEIAFFSLTSTDLQKIAKQKSANSHRILALCQEPRRLYATLLIGSNLITVAIIFIAHFFVCYLFQNWKPGFTAIHVSQNVNAVWANAVSFSVTATVVAFLMLLFNEAMPKAYAQKNKMELVKRMALPLTGLVRLLHPFSMLLLNANRLVEKRLAKMMPFRKKAGKVETEELLDLSASNANENGSVEPERDILKSIVKFSDVTVRQIMTSRMDVVAVDEKVSYQELLDVISASGYSRIPVYDDDFDYIKGILYVKDLLKHLNVKEDFSWQALIRPTILYVPEAKKISELLKEFQRQRLHLAVVVDEYGGSAGIVTLEDVLEEIIGDIKDEFDDEPEVQFRKLDDYNYIFEGKTALSDVYRITGIPESTFDGVPEDADSLAGLILALHGQIPRKDSELTYKNFRFKIIAVTKGRIEQVQMSFEPMS